MEPAEKKKRKKGFLKQKPLGLVGHCIRSTLMTGTVRTEWNIKITLFHSVMIELES